MAQRSSVVASIALSVAIAVVALAHPSSASGQAPWDCTGPWHMWHGAWAFWWVFPLGMITFLIIAALGAFLLFRRGGAHPMRGGAPWHPLASHERPWGGDPTFSALQLLNERFARGEIQKQEYDEKKAAILSSVPR